MTGGPKGPNRTEYTSSSDLDPGNHDGGLGGRKGQNPIGLSFCPPVLQGLAPSGNGPFEGGPVEDQSPSGFVLSYSTPLRPDLAGDAIGGRNKPPEGAASVLRTPERPSSRFLSLDEAALFDERAAIREHDGGIPRAAAERLAWLDVLAARQLAAHASEILARAS